MPQGLAGLCLSRSQPGSPTRLANPEVPLPTYPLLPGFLRQLALGLSLLLLPALPAAAQPAAAGDPTAGLLVRQAKYRAPELIFSSPPGLSRLAAELERADPKRYAEIAELLDLEDPGPPIRVHLVPEGAEETRLVPSWAVAFALSEAGIVVLIPSRVPAYPDGDLKGVLRHEVAHVLIARAAGRQPVPRFFDEGLAVVAAREWQLQDRSRLLMAVWPLAGKDLPALREDFAGGAQQAENAYVVSAAFVRFLLEREGGDAAARILRRISEGHDFDSAVRFGIGHPLEQIQEAFWADIDIWQKWVPLISGSTGFSLLLLVLTALAWRRRKKRDREQQELWEAEEQFARLAAARLLLENEPLGETPREGRTASGEWIN